MSAAETLRQAQTIGQSTTGWHVQGKRAPYPPAELRVWREHEHRALLLALLHEDGRALGRLYGWAGVQVKDAWGRWWPWSERLHRRKRRQRKSGWTKGMYHTEGRHSSGRTLTQDPGEAGKLGFVVFFGFYKRHLNKQFGERRAPLLIQ